MSVGAWHFVRLVNGVPTLRDGRPMPTDGRWLVHEGPVVPCESGLHASVRPLDALGFLEWSDAAICLVDCDGEIVHHAKLVCSRRRVIDWAPCDDVLRGFARRCALAVIDLWDAPTIVRTFLATGDETIRDAAGAAAGDAARAAARDAARAAAWDAAGAAAWAAARAAAGAAARDAAGAAAWDAAGAAAWAAARDAAGAAAWDAARAAARDAQNADLELALLRLLGIEVAR